MSKPTCPMCTFEGKACPGGAHVFAQYEDGIITVADYVRKCLPIAKSSNESSKNAATD